MSDPDVPAFARGRLSLVGSRNKQAGCEWQLPVIPPQEPTFRPPPPKAAVQDGFLRRGESGLRPGFTPVRT